jgi:ABC-type uncharacterized transport system substrate-binding protein
MNQKRATHTRWLLIGIVLLMVGIVLSACAASAPAATSGPASAPKAASTQANYAGKKILFVDSYNEGYSWSDSVESAIRAVLADTGIELKVVHLDNKRHPDEAFAKAAALQAKAEIETFKPDVVIASDDPAQKYLIVPYFKGTNLPVVFDGINWDASPYGYPTSNVTGMVEVELIASLMEQLKAYAVGGRVGYLAIDTSVERTSVDIYNRRFFDGKLKVYLVKTFDEFKQAFLQVQNEVDILLIGNNAGSDRWDEAEMRKFILDNAKIPSGSVRDWTAPYAMVTLAKVAEEQGEWATRTALRILDGTPVSQIPLVENKKGKLILNLELANKLGIVLAPSMLKNAEIYRPTGQ